MEWFCFIFCKRGFKQSNHMGNFFARICGIVCWFQRFTIFTIALSLIVLITNVLILARLKMQSKNVFWNTLYKEHCIINNFLHELPLAITPILRWCLLVKGTPSRFWWKYNLRYLITCPLFDSTGCDKVSCSYLNPYTTQALRDG